MPGRGNVRAVGQEYTGPRCSAARTILRAPVLTKAARGNCHNGYAKIALTMIDAAELMADPEFLGGYRD
jgi:hypothetical protein